MSTKGPTSALPLTALAAAYGLAALTVVRGLGGQKRAWLLAANGQHYVLKLYSDPDWSVLAREVTLLRHCATSAAATFRVPALLTLAGGELFCRHQGQGFFITALAKGRMRSWQHLGLDNWNILGASLAGLHRCLRELAPESVSGLPLCDDAEYQLQCIAAQMAVVQQLKPHALQRATAAYLKHCQTLITQLAAPIRLESALDAISEQQWLHNDFNQYNYRFSAGLPPLILDFERAAIGFCEYELLRSLNHIPLIKPQAAEVFIKGYQRVSPINMPRLMRMLKRYLWSLACKRWPLDLALQGHAWGNTHLRGNIEIMNCIMQAPEELSAFYQRAVT